MIHDGNKIIGHDESEKTIQEILYCLNSHDEELAIKFAKLLRRVEDLQISLDACFNLYLKEVKP